MTATFEPARPAATYQAILDAAEELFATQGFDPTTIKEIGRRAGVNPGLLYYYFPDKAGLYQAVLGRIATTLSQGATARLERAGTAEEVIEAIVEAQAELLIRHPRAVTLIIREMIDHQAAHAQPVIHELAVRLFRPVAEAIEKGKATGMIRADLDPRFATISTIAQLVYFTLAQPLIRILLDQGPSYPTPDDVRIFGRHAAGFAVAGIRGPTPKRQAT
ncbi:MAG: TetR/AcrR family transcriptional regulator [Gemmatimonadetes bacterium]|nr:TetR/AcrR family transcriptional regulator [Gemmatimonadota bacterium]